jgi:hypothetical protein
MKLNEYLDPLAYDIAFSLAGLKEASLPLPQLGDLSLDAGQKLRTAAIIVLLVKGDADGFCHNLIRSGLAREAYLRAARQRGGIDDHHFASGRYDSFLDAVAANDLDLARRIAALSPEDWRDGHEYEDDYCYAQVLHRLVAAPAPDAPGARAYLAQFERYLDGEANRRFDVARALVDADQAAFDAAFEDLLALRDAEIAADKQRGQLEEPQVVAQRAIFVEGLALLRLATIRGLTTQPDYRFCPMVARVPMAKPFPGE